MAKKLSPTVSMALSNSLKELRNCISRIICVWSLFFSIRVYGSLHFLPILLENYRFLSFCAFCVICLFCVEFDAIVINLIQLTLDNSNTRKLEHLVRSNKFVGTLNLLTLFRQRNLYNSNTRKLEHHGRSNKFVGPLDEFLSIARTFPCLSKVFQ